jgi:tetratricopeptide (TPR) repeat protein
LSVYRMTPEQFDAAIAIAIRQPNEGLPLGGTTRKESAQHQQATVSEFEQRLLWADLLAAHPSTAAKAKALSLELEKERANESRVHELLGHIAWKAKQSDEAQNEWAKAVELGSDDFETLYQFALLLHAKNASSSQVIALLERAVSVEPDNDEAIYNLGLMKYDEGQYKGASETLLRLRQIAPDRAYTYYSVLAYCNMKAKTFDRAQSFLLKAAESARTADEQAENARMMRFATVRAD